ncbi:mevalonate kinase [Micropruina sp.]|uniref:mevalonate kinase n=1 Tax=Micropruina sp. TaxID=2737536 RepID=UPI002612EE0F|nr:mevalonate kinase [Micropruina sp.]
MTTPGPSPYAPAVPAPAGVGTAHAKTILIGEHAVVYGAPAIALPVHGLATRAELDAGGPWALDCALHHGTVDDAPVAMAPVINAWQQAVRRVAAAIAQPDTGRPHLTGRLTVTSGIPMQRGLGSSAAVAAAVVDAVASASGVPLGLADRTELVQQSEMIAHGRASGIDTAAVLSDAPILFEQGAIAPVSVGGRFVFVVADTGVTGSTATAVGGVRSLRETQPGLVDGLVDRLSELSRVAVGCLQQGDLDTLGATMDEAHDSLNRLGVGSDELDRLVGAARRAGALGAKLTGGGLGGCVVALSRADDVDRVQYELQRAGSHGTWTTTLEGPA